MIILSFFVKDKGQDIAAISSSKFTHFMGHHNSKAPSQILLSFNDYETKE